MNIKPEIIKSEPIKLIELIDVEPKSAVVKTIITKPTVVMSIVALDAGEILDEKVIPFDTIIQDIDGVVEIVVDKNTKILVPGEVILIPPHTKHSVKAIEPVKIVLTVIKSGYDI